MGLWKMVLRFQSLQGLSVKNLTATCRSPNSIKRSGSRTRGGLEGPGAPATEGGFSRNNLNSLISDALLALVWYTERPSCKDKEPKKAYR